MNTPFQAGKDDRGTTLPLHTFSIVNNRADLNYFPASLHADDSTSLAASDGETGSRQKLVIRWFFAEGSPGFLAVVDQRKLRPFKYWVIAPAGSAIG